MLRSALFSLSILSLVSFMGCSGGGEGGDRKPTHKVSGKVTMGGGPVADASVMFAPQEGQPVATGRTDSSGNYSLTSYEANDGAVAGKYKVVVTKNPPSAESNEQATHEAITAGKPPADHSGPGAGESQGSLLPEKYSSASSTPLETTVEEGQDNTKKDFELEP